VFYSLDGTGKFYSSLLGSLAVTHIVDTVLDSLSNLFRSHRYSPLEKLYSVVLFISGLNLREMKERTKRFHNNVNPKKSKIVEELVTATAIMHNVTRARGEEVTLT
jgi:hypothetical protein